MIHYRDGTQSYQELLDYTHRELNNCSTLVNGSDGAKAIKKAVDSVFRNPRIFIVLDMFVEILNDN